MSPEYVGCITTCFNRVISFMFVIGHMFTVHTYRLQSRPRPKSHTESQSNKPTSYTSKTFFPLHLAKVLWKLIRKYTTSSSMRTQQTCISIFCFILTLFYFKIFKNIYCHHLTKKDGREKFYFQLRNTKLLFLVSTDYLKDSTKQCFLSYLWLYFNKHKIIYRRNKSS